MEHTQRPVAPLAEAGTESREALRAARALARRSGSSFYYSFLLLPRDRRDAIITVYAWCRRADDIADGPGSAAERRKQLDAMRAELELVFAPELGRAGDPVTRALAPVVRRFPIPRQLFLDLLDGVSMDLSVDRYETFEDLRGYAYRVASVVGLMAIEIFGYRDARARDYAEHLGLALQLTNILRDVAGDRDAGRLYLPLEDLRSCGLEIERAADLSDTPALRRAAALTGERARACFEAAARCLPRGDAKTLFPAIVMGRVYERILARIEARGFDVLGPRVRVSRPRKAAIALQEWLRARIAGPV